MLDCELPKGKKSETIFSQGTKNICCTELDLLIFYQYLGCLLVFFCQLRLAGTCEWLCSSLCPSRDTQSRVPRATSRQLWEIPKEETPHLWAACASAPSLHSTEGLLVFRGNLLCSSLCPWSLLLAPGITGRAWLQSVAPSLGDLWTLMRSP